MRSLPTSSSPVRMSRYGRPKMFSRIVFLWIRVADSPVIRSPGWAGRLLE
jgi:hypothetical protein